MRESRVVVAELRIFEKGERCERTLGPRALRAASTTQDWCVIPLEWISAITRIGEGHRTRYTTCLYALWEPALTRGNVGLCRNQFFSEVLSILSTAA